MDKRPKEWDFPLDENDLAELHRRIRERGPVRQVFEAPHKSPAEIAERQLQVDQYQEKEALRRREWEKELADLAVIRKGRERKQFRSDLLFNAVAYLIIITIAIMISSRKC